MIHTISYEALRALPMEVRKRSKIHTLIVLNERAHLLEAKMLGKQDTKLLTERAITIIPWQQQFLIPLQSQYQLSLVQAHH